MKRSGDAPETDAQRRRMTPSAVRFEGRRVLVTGGAQGIGRSVAEAFVEEGALVFVADLVAPQGSGSDRLKFLHCDAASADDIKRSCDAAGEIDILVNNCAVQPEAPCHEHSLLDWNRALAVGLTSYFLFSKYLLPHMLSKGQGNIINIASVQGSQSQAGIPAYSAVKGGVLSLTRQLAVEYASKGIRVNSVSPGSIATQNFLDSLHRRRGSTIETAGAAYPMKRLGKPNEVANLVLFLASDAASFMTAENVTVDGGIMGLGGWATVA
mmetsp:Transcript_46310/g.89169  ORF Transcript_46310/g.89169 Transcript_46310/m.89169 type:complete len:268 (-) Transcript_46310:55-858(-)